MNDTTASSTDTITGERRTHIEEVCARHAFPLREATLHRDVLTLVPTSLDGLPHANQLQELADELEEAGFRFVTFSVPASDEPSS